MNFRIADTFTASLARLTGEEQKAAKTTAFDLQMNAANPGLSFHNSGGGSLRWPSVGEFGWPPGLSHPSRRIGCLEAKRPGRHHLTPRRPDA